MTAGKADYVDVNVTLVVMGCVGAAAGVKGVKTLPSSTIVPSLAPKAVMASSMVAKDTGGLLIPLTKN